MGRPPGMAWIVERRKWTFMGEGDRIPFQTLMVDSVGEDEKGRTAVFRGVRLEEEAEEEDYLPLTKRLGLPANRRMWEGKYEFSIGEGVMMRAQVIRRETIAETAAVNKAIAREMVGPAYQETRQKAQLVEVERLEARPETPPSEVPGSAAP